VVRAYTTRHPSAISDAELAHLERIRIYRVGFEALAWDILVEHLSTTLAALMIQASAYHQPFLRVTHHILNDWKCLVDFQAPVLRSTWDRDSCILGFLAVGLIVVL
jgi:hypothetical protein